jgi:glutathione S-transferase
LLHYSERRQATVKNQQRVVGGRIDDLTEFAGVLADRPFLCGESLTLADIPAATSLYRYFEIEIERPSVPNVEVWYRRLQERPAYREHVMVPFGELYGRLDY